MQVIVIKSSQFVLLLGVTEFCLFIMISLFFKQCLQCSMKSEDALCLSIDLKDSRLEFSSPTLHKSFSSVTQSCATLCDSMDCSMPAFPVHHQLRELAQTHVHGVGAASQPSHPQGSHSPPYRNVMMSN